MTEAVRSPVPNDLEREVRGIESRIPPTVEEAVPAQRDFEHLVLRVVASQPSTARSCGSWSQSAAPILRTCPNGDQWHAARDAGDEVTTYKGACLM